MTPPSQFGSSRYFRVMSSPLTLLVMLGATIALALVAFR